VTSQLGPVKLCPAADADHQIPKEFRMLPNRTFASATGCCLGSGNSAPSGLVLNTVRTVYSQQTQESLMMRRSFNHSVSAEDQITLAKWTRAVAAIYASITFLAVMWIAVPHYRGDGAQSQVVTRSVQTH